MADRVCNGCEETTLDCTKDLFLPKLGITLPFRFCRTCVDKILEESTPAKVQWAAEPGWLDWHTDPRHCATTLAAPSWLNPLSPCTLCHKLVLSKSLNKLTSKLPKEMVESSFGEVPEDVEVTEAKLCSVCLSHLRAQILKTTFLATLRVLSRPVSGPGRSVVTGWSMLRSTGYILTSGVFEALLGLGNFTAGGAMTGVLMGGVMGYSTGKALGHATQKTIAYFSKYVVGPCLVLTPGLLLSALSLVSTGRKLPLSLIFLLKMR